MEELKVTVGSLEWDVFFEFQESLDKLEQQINNFDRLRFITAKEAGFLMDGLVNLGDYYADLMRERGVKFWTAR